MKNSLIISIGIFASLAASRFIPHPPNFTSLLALSFYVPALLGLRFLPILLLSFIITDLVIGYHTGTHWTWGSVVLIGFLSQYFKKKITFRIIGALLGAFVFFTITNFGVWTLGSYGYNFQGFVLCFYLALPFFAYSIVSTLFFSTIIETVYYLWQKKLRQII